MMEMIVELFGEEFGAQIVISFSGIFELFFCALIFNLRTQRREHFPLWLLLCFFISIGISFLLAFLRYLTADHFVLKTISHSLITILTMTLLVFLMYDKDVYQKLITLCATYSTYMLTGRLISLLLNLFGVDDKVSISFFTDYVELRDWSIYIILHLALYLIFGLIFYRRYDAMDGVESSKKRKKIVALSIPSVIFSSFLFSLSDPYQNESWVLSILLKLFSCIICLLILILCSGILNESKKDREMVVLNELFDQEKSQFDNLRLSTEAINSKFHDIKHQLDQMNDRLTDEEISSLKEATDIYDSTIDTGSDVLNAVLFEKQLIAKQEGIRLSALCDGKLLSFMEQTEVYSLVGNALNNALEATEKLTEKDKKIIDITLREDRGMVILNITNYFNGEVRLDEDGLPLSTKTDGKNHGYGTKSIRYITERHHDSLTYSISDDIFSLTISF